MIANKEVKSILNKHKKRDSWFIDDNSILTKAADLIVFIVMFMAANTEKIFVDVSFIKTNSKRIKRLFNS